MIRTIRALIARPVVALGIGGVLVSLGVAMVQGAVARAREELDELSEAARQIAEGLPVPGFSGGVMPVDVDGVKAGDVDQAPDVDAAELVDELAAAPA